MVQERCLTFNNLLNDRISILAASEAHSQLAALISEATCHLEYVITVTFSTGPQSKKRPGAKPPSGSNLPPEVFWIVTYFIIFSIF